MHVKFSENTNTMWGGTSSCWNTKHPGIKAASTGLPNKLFELHFHTPSAVLFFAFGSIIIGHGNPDNNLESHRIIPTYLLSKYLTKTDC
jgi:hypothetical protein